MNMIEDVEYIIYCKLFDQLVKDLPPIQKIYLKTSVEIAKTRTNKRTRKGEILKHNYIEKLHNQHEEWFIENDTLVLDGNPDIETNQKHLETLYQQVFGFINVNLSPSRNIAIPNNK